MAKPEISTKRIAISKANAQMVGIVAAAAFVTVFCLIASKAVLSQNQYQAKVTGAKEKAHRQLQANIKNFSSLNSSYQRFDKQDPNIIDRSSTGTGDNEGLNSKIILDALPSSYDFPGLASSLEKIFDDNSLHVSSIVGVDDQLAQQEVASSPTPQPVAMPFTFTINNANYDSVSKLVGTLEHSIRPIQVDKLNLSGSNGTMTLTVDAHTFYQPGKTVDIKKQVQK
jgi:hypothetical protein